MNLCVYPQYNRIRRFLRNWTFVSIKKVSIVWNFIFLHECRTRDIWSTWRLLGQSQRTFTRTWTSGESRFQQDSLIWISWWQTSLNLGEIIGETSFKELCVCVCVCVCVALRNGVETFVFLDYPLHVPIPWGYYYQPIPRSILASRSTLNIDGHAGPWPVSGQTKNWMILKRNLNLLKRKMEASGAAFSRTQNLLLEGESCWMS
jgi:hypothetical protein